MSKLRKVIKKYKSLGTSTNTFGGNDLGTFMKEISAEFDKLNDKIGQDEEPTRTSGAVGSIRVIFDKDTPFIEVKSEKGWVRSDSSSASGFSFKK